MNGDLFNINVKLWNSPYNGGWISFNKKSLKRFDAGCSNNRLWWATLGFCGYFVIQSWPFQKFPSWKKDKEFIRSVDEAIANRKDGV